MMHRGFVAMAIAMCGTLASAADRPVPYWASVTAGDALMRTGPGRNYPAVWRYRRKGLPVKVLQVHESWRKVSDRDGTVGWVSAALLSAERTAIVVGEIRPMLASPEEGSRILWRAAPGVIGKVRHCANGWCKFDVDGKSGFIASNGIWGIEPGEAID